MSAAFDDAGLAEARETETPGPALLRSATSWVEQLHRAVKTCRLYEPNNPTAAMLRDELGRSLGRLLDAHGPLRFEFTHSAVKLRGAVVHHAAHRDDNLAGIFHRDGVRAIAFEPGIAPDEVGHIVRALVTVSQRHPESDEAQHEDLVTLLWSDVMRHVFVDEVPQEGDIETGASDEASLDDARIAPWPAGGGAEAEASDGPAPETDRADDWPARHAVGEFASTFRQLDADAPARLSAFAAARSAEVADPLLHATLALVRDCTRAEVGPDDLATLAQFVPRLLRESLGAGDWSAARHALHLLRPATGGDWSAAAFVDELRHPASIVTPRVRAHLEEQPAAAMDAFAAVARDLGPPCADWLMQLLCDIEQRRVRQQLTRVIADVCRDEPERLGPWLADERWYVVRNATYILGLIGSPLIAGMLAAVAAHPEHRVRREVVVALDAIEPGAARPVLRRMLDRSDPRIRLAALEALAVVRDPEIARDVLDEVRADRFDDRPEVDRHALYAVLGRLADDSVLPAIEDELHAGGWFARPRAAHRAGLAQAIAAIGTPAAREALGRGASSRHGAVRSACAAASGDGRA